MTSVPKRTLNIEEHVIYKRDISTYETQNTHYSVYTGLKVSIRGVGALV